MSCSFWNMRRRLKAQKGNDKVVVDIATAQAEEKTAKTEEKPVEQAKTTSTSKKSAKKGGVNNDSTTD